MTMTAAQFRRALEQLRLTQGEAALSLELSVRTINGYANGDEIPLVVELALETLLRRKTFDRSARPRAGAARRRTPS